MKTEMPGWLDSSEEMTAENIQEVDVEKLLNCFIDALIVEKVGTVIYSKEAS